MVINFEAGCSGNIFVAITELIVAAEACPLLLLLMQQLNCCTTASKVSGLGPP